MRVIKQGGGFNFYDIQNSDLNVEFELGFDVEHVLLQADLFSRELLTHKTRFDFKRIFGHRSDDWYKEILKLYIYDALKSIYYGLNANKFRDFPDRVYSFPGNALRMALIKTNQFQFHTKGELPYHIYLRIKTKNFDEYSRDFFKMFPDLNEGVSNDSNFPAYLNSKYEGYITGLFNAFTFLESQKGTSSKLPGLYEVISLFDPKLTSFLQESSFPFMNSFLSKDLRKFNFILPSEFISSPETMKFNYSLFIGRAIGLVSNQIYVDDNPLYKMVNRQERDVYAKYEMHSITGLKTELLPYSFEHIITHLGIVEVVTKVRETNSGGDDTSTP
jgi:hypothetical protein